jgi:hypothetical protein
MKKEFDFMIPLVDATTSIEPDERSAIDEVLYTFRLILASLSERQLRARINAMGKTQPRINSNVVTYRRRRLLFTWYHRWHTGNASTVSTVPPL